MSDWLMVIGAGMFQVPAIKQAQKMGLKVLATDGSEKAPGADIADAFRVASTREPQENVQVAKEFAKNHALKGVITIGTDVPYTVASVAAALGLPGIPTDVALRSQNKALMREAFWAHGVPCPRFVVASALEDLGALLQSDKFVTNTGSLSGHHHLVIPDSDPGSQHDQGANPDPGSRSGMTSGQTPVSSSHHHPVTNTDSLPGHHHPVIPDSDPGSQRDQGANSDPGSLSGMTSGMTSLTNTANGQMPLTYPLVIKPVDNMGARGVRRVDNWAELSAAFPQALEHSREGQVIVEEYMAGPELSVDTVVENGKVHLLTIADRHIEKEPYFVEVGHSLPSALPKNKLKAVFEVMKQGIEALGITHGAAKADMKVTPYGPMIGEMTARMSGGFHCQLTDPLSTGMNSIKAAIDLALGRKLDPKDITPSFQRAAVERAIIPEPGVVQSVRGIGDAAALDGVAKVLVHAKPGDEVHNCLSNVQKSGHVVAWAESREQAEQIAAEALQKIVIETVPREVPFHRASIGPEEEQAVLATLRSYWLTTGPQVKQFEQDCAQFLDAPYAVALDSCTSGLHLSLLAAGVGPGDEVLLPAHTFASTANVIEHVGAKPVFVDVDPIYGLVDMQALEHSITARTKALMPVHFAGYMCDMQALQRLAQKHDLALIEDAAHCLEGDIDGVKPGQLSDAAAFSFYATKNITTFEGGMLVTPHEKWAERIRTLSLHGLSRKAWSRYETKGSPFYQVTEPGFKCNMTDVQASVGRVQLRKAEAMLARREELWQFYCQELEGLEDLQLPVDQPGAKLARHLFIVRLPDESLRNAMIEQLKQRGIGSSVHFRGLHLQDFYRQKYGLKPEDFPNATKLAETSLSLPFYPDLGLHNAQFVTQSLKQAIHELTAGCRH